jgi:hypothetical protein
MAEDGVVTATATGIGSIRRWFVALAVLIAALAMSATSAQAGASEPTSTDELEQQLAERYAPVVMIKQQADECDPDGEPYRPADVATVLENPEIALRQLSDGNPLVTRGPTASDLFELGEGFFLDFPGSPLTPGCIYERDFDKFTAGIPPTVYAHVVQQPDEPDLVFVQYWFYWYFNDWNNKHESDWEGVTLKFEASTVDEALAVGPSEVGYSQHEGGERANWDDDKLEREGDHPVVYSSAGSHASYFGSAVYLGRGASEGFGCDDTTGPSERLDPAVVVLPDAVSDASDPLAWLSYEGRWGERQRGSFNGPTGPIVKDRWLEPAPWFDDLRPSSVVIPAGDSAADEVIDVFCGLVERGSAALITWSLSPARLIVIAIGAVLLARFLIGRTDWKAVPAEPIVRRRRAGQILRGAFRAYRREPAVYVMFGLVYLPAALITGLLMGLVALIPFVSSILSLATGASGTSLALAALAGSIANVAAFVVVSAVVAEYLDRAESGVDGAVLAIRTTWGHRRELMSGFARSFAIVFALLATFVGAPWGIRQLVRYQFVPQTIMFGDCDGRGSLRRSTDLVRGRWWHTALVTAVINASTTATALFVGLLLLVVVSGIPLWIFSALISLVYVLVAPLAAIAMTLLYGDARAEAEGDALAAPVPAEVS